MTLNMWKNYVVITQNIRNLYCCVMENVTANMMNVAKATLWQMNLACFKKNQKHHNNQEWYLAVYHKF